MNQLKQLTAYQVSNVEQIECLSAENLICVSCKNVNLFHSYSTSKSTNSWIVNVLWAKQCHKNFKCRGDYQKQDRDAKCQWKAPGEKWRMDISKKKESMSMTKNYKGGMPTSKRYFSAWKGLNLLRMKIKFVLPSRWIHAQCNICFLAPWQVISKIAHLHTSTVKRLWDLCCFSSLIHVIC